MASTSHVRLQRPATIKLHTPPIDKEDLPIGFSQRLSRTYTLVVKVSTGSLRSPCFLYLPSGKKEVRLSSPLPGATSNYLPSWEAQLYVAKRALPPLFHYIACNTKLITNNRVMMYNGMDTSLRFPTAIFAIG